MKKIALLLLCGSLLIIACQKELAPIDPVMGNGEDTLIAVGDTITYEVITTDTVGWFGIWSQPDGQLGGNPLSNGTYGSPVYYHSGWKYSFAAPDHPFQAFLSVATHLYSDSIIINLYHNGKLIKTSGSDSTVGVAKLLADINTKEWKGTATDPVLTYEVLVSNPDTTKFQSDAWIGQWNTAADTMSDYHLRLATDFAIPSGWRYSFKPKQLPFHMRIGLSPYTKQGATVTANYYVNGELVKTFATNDWQYANDVEYLVQ